jgi:hypothetical protein
MALKGAVAGFVGTALEDEIALEGTPVVVEVFDELGEGGAVGEEGSYVGRPDGYLLGAQVA